MVFGAKLQKLQHKKDHFKGKSQPQNLSDQQRHLAATHKTEESP